MDFEVAKKEVMLCNVIIHIPITQLGTLVPMTLGSGYPVGLGSCSHHSAIPRLHLSRQIRGLFIF